AIPDAYVGLYNTQTREWHGGRTDQEGIARIRLMPGTYRQQNVSKEGYTGQQMQEPVEVTEGKTQRLTVQLRPQPKIRGVVMDQTGKPVPGATVRILPGGGGEDLTTGKDGKFEIAARRFAWGGGGGRGREESQLVVVARHKHRNLAAAVEVEDESKPLEVKLRPSATLAGRVTDLDGKPVPNARLMVMLRSRMWGSPIRSGGYLITDSQGRYEIKAIPPTQKYSVTAEADGFGKMELQTELDEEEIGRVELENLVLAPANLSISGVVVDDEDKPVAGAHVGTYGDRQPHQNTITDKEGKFVFKQVVADEFRVSAYINTADGQQHGSVNTKGGDKDVKVVLGQSPGSRPRLPKPRSLLGKPLGDLEQFGLKPASEIAAGKRMLICFWNMEQRPSRHCIRGLAEKADELAKKGVVVVSVHASAVEPDKLKAWTVKYKIPFSAGAVSAGAKKSERTLRKWGVRALPWLILTDKGHIVHAEGFPLGELDATMSEFPSK
ncbi:MAG TPA: carboxypeptidase regulatory-like domain-containing protein, partial [Phycisphaerae bacterium]|nr:carboxypeptidase regulatory-like domain-containing protein [Phycisphaerae bacterium]